MNPFVALPCLSLDAAPVRVVVVRRERSRAVLADGSPASLTDPRCAADFDGDSEATMFREYLALRADTHQPVALSFSGARERVARMLNVLLEMPYKGKSIPYFAHVFALSASSVVHDGFCSEELFQVAEATYEAAAGRRLVVDGVAAP